MPHHSPITLLLQSTAHSNESPYHIKHFTALVETLNSLTSEDGTPLLTVTARNRRPDFQDHDPVLSRIESEEFDVLWLLAGDDSTLGEGLTADDCLGISAYGNLGGTLWITKGPNGLGTSLTKLDESLFSKSFQTAVGGSLVLQDLLHQPEKIIPPLKSILISIPLVKG